MTKGTKLKQKALYLYHFRDIIRQKLYIQQISEESRHTDHEFVVCTFGDKTVESFVVFTFQLITQCSYRCKIKVFANHIGYSVSVEHFLKLCQLRCEIHVYLLLNYLIFTTYILYHFVLHNAIYLPITFHFSF